VTLVVENLSQARGGRTLFAGVSFTVKPGEALILTGPNGAGKTTLIRTLAGFLTPIAGSIRLDGGDPEATVGEQSHYVGHVNAIKAALTVQENADFWARYLATNVPAPLVGEGQGGGEPQLSPISPTLSPSPQGGGKLEALHQLGLSELADIPAAFLSAGQKRRLGLSRLLLAHRPLWLLDEPTVSLDAANRDRLAGIINAHLAAGGMVVAATHLPLGLLNARELDLTTASQVARAEAL
jgi:heme exporter protein A